MWILLTSVLMLHPTAPQDAWPAFLGAGHSPIDSQSLPLEWSPETNIAWSVEIPGHGQSSPVSWGDRVFVTSVIGPNKETYHIQCFDVNSGERLWDYQLENSSPVENSVYVSRAAPTPVVDDQRIVVLFESGDCVALTHDGKPLWTIKLGETFGPFKNEFGLGASLCQSGDNAFALLEHDGPSYLLAINKATGDIAWKAQRTARRSWSSPAIVEVNGTVQVVVSSAGSVDGYLAETGEQLWTYTDVGGNTATTPIDCGDGRFLVAASAGRQGENEATAKTSNMLMQIQQADGQWSVQRLWFNEDATPTWASPILHNGHAYWVNRVGVVYCIDATDGSTTYAKRIGQSCWATPLAVDDRIYMFGKDGLTTVLAAGPEFKTLAENQLWDPDALPEEPAAGENEATEERRRAAAMFSGPTQYGYAVNGNKILMRIGNRLYAIGQ